MSETNEQAAREKAYAIAMAGINEGSIDAHEAYALGWNAALEHRAQEQGEVCGNLLGGLTPEQMAKRFHDAYEHFAPLFGYETRAETKGEWEQLPENNKDLMVAVIRNVLIEQAHPAPPSDEAEG
jgi:hypothetical protein